MLSLTLMLMMPRIALTVKVLLETLVTLGLMWSLSQGRRAGMPGSSMLRWTPYRKRGRSLESSPLFWIVRIGVAVETGCSWVDEG